MGKKIPVCCVMVLLMEAAAGPLEVFAEGDPLASPAPRLTQRAAAPVVYGADPQITLPEGDLGDINPSGSSFSRELYLPEGEAQSLMVDLIPPGLNSEDVSCGPAALAEALRLLKRDHSQRVPDASELEKFLQDRGLMYPWGTGVEELAYAARCYGFPATRALNRISLEDLTRALNSGNPLVVLLGMNGPGQPGHFVVLTGASRDGEWISCVDTTRGTLLLSREEFSFLWELQGRTGLAFPGNVPADVFHQRRQLGYVPWAYFDDILHARKKY